MIEKHEERENEMMYLMIILAVILGVTGAVLILNTLLYKIMYPNQD